jgi:uncharacterized membrane protein
MYNYLKKDQFLKAEDRDPINNINEHNNKNKASGSHFRKTDDDYPSFQQGIRNSTTVPIGTEFLAINIKKYNESKKSKLKSRVEQFCQCLFYFLLCIFICILFLLLFLLTISINRFI